MKALGTLPYRNSLVFTTTIWLAAASIVIVLFLGVLNTRFIQAEYRQMEEQKIATIMSDALKLLGINLSYGFEKAINETGKAILANDYIIAVRIKDELKGKEYKFSKTGSSDISGDLVEEKSIIDPATGQKIGLLTLICSRSGYREMMIQYYSNLAMVMLIYLCSVALLVRFIYKRLSPLRQLAEAMQKFSPDEGKFDFPDNLKSSDQKDEIAAITRAFRAMMHNIMEYSKRLEELNRELQRSHDELEHKVLIRTAELKDKQMQLAHAGRLAALGELAAGVAHELGQPLQIIKSAALIISEELEAGTFEPEEMAPIAAKITHQVDRAFSIISSMRKFVRQNGPRHAACASNLSEALEDALSFFRAQFSQHGITLDVQVEENLPRAAIDSQKFQQIVVNLLSNARFAVDKKAGVKSDSADKKFEKTISVKLERYNHQKESIVLKVTDNGIGMNALEQERCLEPFFTTKEPDEGTGLGLSIAYSIAREYGATLEFETEKGRGTTFSLIMKTASGMGEIT